MDATSKSSGSPSSTSVGDYVKAASFGQKDSHLLLLFPPIMTGSVSSADGSALVKFGETTVLCGIRAEIAEPDILAPNSGFLGEATLLRIPLRCDASTLC